MILCELYTFNIIFMAFYFLLHRPEHSITSQHRSENSNKMLYKLNEYINIHVMKLFFFSSQQSWDIKYCLCCNTEQIQKKSQKQLKVIYNCELNKSSQSFNTFCLLSPPLDVSCATTETPCSITSADFCCFGLGYVTSS